MVRRRVTVLLVASLVALSCGRARSSRKAEVAPERGTVRVAELEVPYVTEGSGRLCIVYALLGYHLRAFSQTFRSQLRCTFVQARFAIPGAPPAPDYSVEAAVGELEAVRAKLGLSGFVLVGHSVQGVVALAYAKKYPQHVTHVVAVGSVPEISPRYFQLEEEGWRATASPERKALWERRKAALTEEALAKLSPSDAIVESIVADGPKRWYDATFDERPLLSHDRFDPATLGVLFAREFKLLADGERYRTPVLLAEGRLDWDFGGEAVWGPYRSRFRDLTVALFERSGHVPQLEESQAFDARVLAWLASR